MSQAPRALLRRSTPAFRALDMSRSAASERLPRQQPRSRRPRRPGRSGAATEEPPHRRSLIWRDLGIAYRYKFPIRRRARTLAGRKPARQCAGLFHFNDSPRRSRSGRPLTELPAAGPPRAPAVHRLLAPGGPSAVMSVRAFGTYPLPASNFSGLTSSRFLLPPSHSGKYRLTASPRHPQHLKYIRCHKYFKTQNNTKSVYPTQILFFALNQLTP